MTVTILIGLFSISLTGLTLITAHNYYSIASETANPQIMLELIDVFENDIFKRTIINSGWLHSNNWKCH